MLLMEINSHPSETIFLGAVGHEDYGPSHLTEGENQIPILQTPEDMCPSSWGLLEAQLHCMP